MTLERIAELRALKAKADAVGMSSIEVAIYTREARTALPEALDAIERVRALAMLGGEPVMTYQQRPVHVVLCSEILAALEGKP